MEAIVVGYVVGTAAAFLLGGTLLLVDALWPGLVE